MDCCFSWETLSWGIWVVDVMLDCTASFNYGCDPFLAIPLCTEKAEIPF